MGNVVGKFAAGVSNVVRGRKRKRGEDDSDTNEDIDSDLLDRSLKTPKRKKLISTAKYIYQALFIEEQNYDITVHALGKVWHLHKVYLSQSPYFASMFNGSWREADEDYIHIEIVDPKITIESLYSVLGSLYMDEVVLEPMEIVSILATATLFQLDGLIDRCGEVMTETTNAETAISYYEAACQYGVKNVKQTTFSWLLVNLLCCVQRTGKWLGQIDSELMKQLVGSPDLYVMQTEFSLYTLLKTWMYLRLHPHAYETTEQKEITAEQNHFFEDLKEGPPFLHTSRGHPYVKVFRLLRLRNLLNHHVDIRILREDNIVPMEWFNEPLFVQWNSMMLIDQSQDKGPVECDERTFLESCIRCGRTLPENIYQKWRWTGFNFGLDLVLISDTKTLRVKRHHRTENERLLSLQTKRNFLIRISLVSLNEQRQIKHQQKTPIQSIALDKNEEAMLAVLDKELTYPLLISVNLLTSSPPKTAAPIAAASPGATASGPLAAIFRSSTGDENAPDADSSSNGIALES